MSDTMSRPDLDAIEQRANAATEGPWAFAFVGEKSNDCVVGTFFVARKNKRLEQVGGSVSEYIDDGIGDFDDVIASKENDANVANFAFIAHARQDIPALIARVRELEEALAKCAAHTAHLPGASRELLEGLLASVRRIVERAKQDQCPGACSPKSAERVIPLNADTDPQSEVSSRDRLVSIERDR